MKKGVRPKVALVLAMTGISACGLPPMISNTGYRGTWSRGNDRNVSIVAIAEVGGRWYFRWTKRSFDGRQTILCDWAGHCEETIDGHPAASYTITTGYDEGSGTLWTETFEERVFPTQRSFRYRDVMEVADSGLALWNYTTDRDGEHFDGKTGPRRSFSKVANGVADPPRPGRP